MPTARSAWRAHVGAHAALGAVASAPRHGFHAPNPSPDELPPERDGVLIWPEGNGWLAGAAHGRAAGRTPAHRQPVLRGSEGRGDVGVDTWNLREPRSERWTAAQAVLVVPQFIAARLLHAPPARRPQCATRRGWSAICIWPPRTGGLAGVAADQVDAVAAGQVISRRASAPRSRPPPPARRG